MFQFKQLLNSSDLNSVYKWLSDNLVMDGGKKPQLHLGNLIFDQFICCQSPEVYSHYYYEIIEQTHLIGYLYLENENYAIYLVQKYESRRSDIIAAVESKFYNSADQVTTVENLTNHESVEKLEQHGYQKSTYYRYSGVAALNKEQLKSSQLPMGYTICEPKAAQADAIVELIGFAIGGQVDLNAYSSLVKSETYQYADTWIVQNQEGFPVAYAVFWIDPESLTAVLEPVACGVAYRGLGLTTALLRHGMQVLADKGIRFVYVGTSGTNQASQALYTRVGFKNYGWEYEFVKTL